MSRGAGTVERAVHRALATTDEWLTVSTLVLIAYPDQLHTKDHRRAVRKALHHLQIVQREGLGVEIDGTGTELRARANRTRWTGNQLKRPPRRSHPTVRPSQTGRPRNTRRPAGEPGAACWSMEGCECHGYDPGDDGACARCWHEGWEHTPATGRPQPGPWDLRDAVRPGSA